MIARIRLSRYSAILTAVLFIALYVGCFATFHEKTAFCCLLSIFLILLLFALLYGTMSIKADARYVIMQSPFRSRRISVVDIDSVEAFMPTMGAIRIFGSGGFMGYWGIFREGDVGRYYAFYGKASDCFLVRMKNGDKYVLGCENPARMMDFIRSHVR